MKKIALLLIILCAHALNGMEQPAPTLPPEVIEVIVNQVYTYDDPDAMIKAIHKLSLFDTNFHTILNDMHGNPEGFKILAHMIAKKFNMQPCDIASRFHTQVAKNYVEICTQLRNKLKAQDIAGVKQLLEQGADVNGFPTLVAVMASQKMPKVAMIQLLLKYGANPYATRLAGVTALQLFNDMHGASHEYDQIDALIRNAMKKQDQ
jgi:hypothetical protein